MKNKKKITVFTPTFNRAYCLHKCYESLINQSSKDFIWLIVDDGSTDNTKKLVETWVSENVIPIEYIYQENLGMHGAHNTAYKNITTLLNVCIDSDDYLVPDAIEVILNFWEKNKDKKFAGIVGLDINQGGEVIGSLLPNRLHSSTLFDLYNVHGVKGDKKIVYRSDLTRMYEYPIFKNEKYVGLAYKYYKIDEEYELLLLNKPLCVVEYLPDGSSLNMFKQYRQNPKGFSFYRKELMSINSANHKYLFKQSIHYVASSLIEKNLNFIKESPKKLYTVAALPFGIILYMLILTKTRKQNF